MALLFVEVVKPGGREGRGLWVSELGDDETTKGKESRMAIYESALVP